ncbi:uncharacterized protein LOC122265212 [Penaeus japonicus]|uniref:uncharacterized protein LOC122265212 n=1 Tax=Penaeus japonicus TaxID=27405 RepID=UPI001C70BD0B|nr:uncharacterized protein LOC122265212 [Penaeus japonicus]
MENNSEKDNFSTSVVLDADCREDEVKTTTTSISQEMYNWAKIIVRVSVSVVSFLGCAFITYLFITNVLYHFGDSGPWDQNATLNNISSHISHSTEGIPNVTQSPSDFRPSPTSSDHESQGLLLEAVNRETQSLQALGCHLTPHKENMASLLRPKDHILDRDFHPKQITIEKCDDMYSYCGFGGKLCAPARNNSVQKEVVLWFYEAGKLVLESRMVESDSDCECQ